MRRTTIRLDDDLLARAKKLAIETNRTLAAVIEDAIRHSLSLADKAGSIEIPELPTYGHGGPCPGVDINNSAELLDILEEGKWSSLM